MTITTPVSGTQITVSGFGQPVAAALNDQTDRAAVLMTKTVGQALTTGIAAAVTFNAETFDHTTALHDTVTQNSRLTIPTGLGGLWLVGYAIAFAANATGIRNAYLRRNGGGVGHTDHWCETTDTGLGGGASTSLAASQLIRLTAGQYLELIATQTSGGNLNVLGNDTFPHLTNLWAVRLGD